MLVINDPEQIKNLITEVIETAFTKVLEEQEIKVYNKKEAAKKIGLSYSYFDKLIKEGVIITSDCGKFISQTALRNYAGFGRLNKKQKTEIAEFLSNYKIKSSNAGVQLESAIGLCQEGRTL